MLRITSGVVLALCIALVAHAAEFKDGGAYGQINSLSEGFGNLDTDLLESDLDKLGITQGSSFGLTHKETTVNVLMGTTYSDVPRGEWVALLNRDGTLRIARNLENAGETLGAKAGDRLFIKPIPQEISR